MNPIKTGQFIQLLRKERKLTQTELADILMITNKAVSRWETGEGFPDVVILPKLSDALGVSVDEILQGERSVKESTKQELHHLRLKNAFLISIVVMVLSYVLFIGLTYGTYRIWIGFIGYVIPATLGLLWILLERNQFMVASVYDDHDQKLLFNTLFRSVTVYVVGFFMTLPQIIFALDSSIVTSVMSFDYYILWALIFGLLGFALTLFGFVYLYEKGKYLKHLRFITNIIAIYFGFAAALTIISIPIYEYLNFVGFQGMLIYLGVGIYYLIKKFDRVYMMALRVWISGAFILAVNAYTISEALVSIFFMVFILAVVTILVSWIMWFRNKQYNALFRFSYQSSFLLLFTLFSHLYIRALMIGLPLIILFEVFVVEKVKQKKVEHIQMS